MQNMLNFLDLNMFITKEQIENTTNPTPPPKKKKKSPIFKTLYVNHTVSMEEHMLTANALI